MGKMNRGEILVRDNEIQYPITHFYWFRSVSIKNNRIISRKMHCHPFYEWHFILDGSMKYTVGDELLTVNKGEHLFLLPETKHRAEWFSNDFIKLSIGFSLADGTPLKKALAELGVANGAYDFKQIDDCIFETERNTIYSAKIVQNRVFEMLCHLAEPHLPTVTAAPEHPDDRLSAAINVIRSFPEKFLSCDEVARACNMSVRQLTRLFQRYEQCTLSDYLHQEKSRQIRALLAEQDISLRTISEKCGFDNEYYFNTFFKRYNNMTPGEYRRCITK